MKKLIVALVFLLALVLLPMGAMAQGGQTWQSGVQVVNLGTEDADVVLTYYNSNGTVAGTVSDVVASSKTYFPLTGVSAGFAGSMVISANQPVTAIANLVNSNFTLGASTTSFGAGSNSVSLPLVMCNNSGFNTFFSVQNAGSATANVTINYIKGSHGANASETTSIEPGAAKSFDQTTGSTTVNCSALSGSDGKFIGGATITSNEPVVATVMQINTGSFKVLMGYNGFTDGSTTVNLPLVMALNSGFYTGIQIQNTGDAQTVVTIDYAANTGGALNPGNETCTLAAGASCTLIQSGGQWTSKYIGAATITASEPLVAIVNQVYASGGVGPFGTAYEGFNPSVATDLIAAPLVMANNSGYYTGIQVQNVGGSTCASVTIDYGANTAGAFNPTNDTFSLTAGSSATYIQNGGQWTGKYIGSADITAPGCSIVAIVNQVAIKVGDNFFTYGGYNH